jgi:hypothetical protein
MIAFGERETEDTTLTTTEAHLDAYPVGSKFHCIVFIPKLRIPHSSSDFWIVLNDDEVVYGVILQGLLL